MHKTALVLASAGVNPVARSLSAAGLAGQTILLLMAAAEVKVIKLLACFTRCLQESGT